MKKIIHSILIVGALSMTGIAYGATHNMITIITSRGQVLEMPQYTEKAVEESIPGDAAILCCQTKPEDIKKQVKLIETDLSRLLLCINKPETAEPFPFELN